MKSLAKSALRGTVRFDTRREFRLPRVEHFAYAGDGDGGTHMNCPNCHAVDFRRSRRKSVLDHLAGFGGAVPWRCNPCGTRFYARPVPIRHLLYAHCSICGNLDLQVISAEYVKGGTSLLWRLMRIPARRCEPCRHKFFTVRPQMKAEQRLALLAAESAGVKYPDSSRPSVRNPRHGI